VPLAWIVVVGAGGEASGSGHAQLFCTETLDVITRNFRFLFCAIFLLLAFSSAWPTSQNPAPSAGRTVQERLGYPASARLLVIHADDLGMAHSVNRAIFEAFENHWITSASVLVPCPWFPEVVTWAKAHPDADLGIHLALNSEWTTFRWRPISAAERVPSLLDAAGYFPLEETDVAARAKIPEVELELTAQIERARAAGIRITHLDSHMSALMGTAAMAEEYQQLGREQKLPILWHAEAAEKFGTEAQPPAGLILNDDDLEIRPGVAPKDWLKAYEEMLAPLKPGVHHLVVHLAHDDDEMRGATADHPDWGAAWRQLDFEMVQSAEFRAFLRQQGFILVSWTDLDRALPKDYSLPAR
jgi:chitin disaccharide deacetylase